VVSDGQDAVTVDNTSVVVPGYEFDEPSSELRGVRQPARRSTGITPRTTKKRVARLDKIMDDIVRHKRMDDEAHGGATNVTKSPLKKASSKSWTDEFCRSARRKRSIGGALYDSVSFAHDLGNYGTGHLLPA